MLMGRRLCGCLLMNIRGVSFLSTSTSHMAPKIGHDLPAVDGISSRGKTRQSKLILLFVST